VTDLLRLWEERWPTCQPDASVLRGVFPDRWVRFHSLPESKRYAETEDEYTTVLGRYNTVLDELFAGEDVYVITPDWNEQPTPDERPEDHARWHPDATYWTSICVDDDPGFEAYWHMYLSRTSWRPGCLDPLLRAVADDETAGVMITDLAMRRIHHPYDGGADILLASTAERDQLHARHNDWLSQHAHGL
jgi:hypothetical protein